MVQNQTYEVGPDEKIVEPPAECSITVTDNLVQTHVRAGHSLEETVSAAHQEARWALDRGDVLFEKYEIIDVSPK
ncbi:hypothetical protein [Natrinema sp. 1APR25-10V2]|uniref:hypothetical protein n=1 Tax=Natrinema sp. 1APR25-10V2 TaxID=2951081 RepID=UPI002876AF98|nr:hypothetical protein [Natrinema sp. 1APR25-10V2]MDS0474035.1 hypothetical protein [Natrinema sp. 1APR25-10V2]